MEQQTFKMALKRIAAFMIDYCVIALYMCVLIFVNVGLMETELEPSIDFGSKIRGHIIAFTTLTLPVWLYFTLSEASRHMGTVGKRVLKLKVQTLGGARAPLVQIALRNAVRLLPWELAHAAIWYVPQRPFFDTMPTLNQGICIFANLLAIGFVAMLFMGQGRTLYDKISKTHVFQAS